MPSQPPLLREPAARGTHTPTTARAVAAEGARDMLPLALGYMPFAVTIGAAIAAGPLNRLAGWSGAPIVAAGTAHLTLVDLLSGGAGVLAAVVAALVINLRLVAYGAGLVPWFAGETRRSRLLLSWFVIDPTYLLAVERFDRDDPGPSLRRSYFLGLAAVLYPLWCVGVGVGVIAGAVVPAALELGMAAPLMMVGMLALVLDRASERRSAAIGLALGVLGLGLADHSLMLIAAAVAFGLALTQRETDR